MYRPQQSVPLDCPPVPNKRECKNPQAVVQVFHLSENQEEDPNAVMIGMLLLEKTYAHFLFDSGASHSFATSKFAKKLSRDLSKMDYVLFVTTLVGSMLQTDVIYRNYHLNISGKNLAINLVKIEIQVFNVILGIDLLAKYQVTIDCKRKLISLTTFEGEKL